MPGLVLLEAPLGAVAGHADVEAKPVSTVAGVCPSELLFSECHPAQANDVNALAAFRSAEIGRRDA